MLRIYWKLSDVNPGHESFSGIQKPSQWTNTGWENIFLYALPIVSDRIFRYQKIHYSMPINLIAVFLAYIQPQA